MEHPHGLCRLGCGHHQIPTDPRESAAHPDQLRLEVDVRPGQGQRFPAAEAGVHKQLEQRLIPGSSGLLDQRRTCSADRYADSLRGDLRPRHDR